MSPILDTASFSLNLKTRRDRGFHVYKELCQFLFKLGRRCVKPSSLPAENDFQAVLQLSFPDAKALSVEDFISRSKLGARLAAGSKSKAEKEMSEEKNRGLALTDVAASIQEEFGRLARGYVANLLNATQSLTRFTSDIVRGLGSFDLEILLLDPIEQATYCFKQLFMSFRLRGVFRADEETVYLEEYLSFIDELRRAHPEVQQPKLLINDAIGFISRQGLLKSRQHLGRIFRLSCLCLDEPRFTFPAVRFGSVRTDEPTCSMFDIVAPIQSYFGSVARGLDNLVCEASIERLLILELTFGTTGLSSTYSPWDGIDHLAEIVYEMPSILKRQSDAESQLPLKFLPISREVVEVRSRQVQRSLLSSNCTNCTIVWQTSCCVNFCCSF